eukprot:CAMPEP_0183442652 /NCGR_PEP_ID=MMETSP0370-20130417/88956_1 /TAXON_ID=268820 /ORGANISM="Peridinium aciculiferum, Strain PAER-2" /LENGTH=243 /DNA_ID=CAMNT_0025632351 /DNA_START=74 /DNA_END=805 /DNA_ORIENTATION=+
MAVARSICVLLGASSLPAAMPDSLRGTPTPTAWSHGADDLASFKLTVAFGTQLPPQRASVTDFIDDLTPARTSSTRACANGTAVEAESATTGVARFPKEEPKVPQGGALASRSTPRRSLTPAKPNVLTLYHQTSAELGPLILKTGFRLGKHGWCGGGIYFAVTPEATFTKAIGQDSHTGYIIEATVDVGKVKIASAACDHLWEMNATRLTALGFDSISFDPADGDEYVVYTASRVLTTRHYGE